MKIVVCIATELEVYEKMMSLVKQKKFILFGVVLTFSWGFVDSTFSRMFFRNAIHFRENQMCNDPKNDTKYAIIVHGWKETCNTKWAIELEKKLSKHRGGCIICMDYRFFSYWPHYFLLAQYTPNIARVLKIKLEKLESKGFDPNNGYIFGFSLGGRIALEAGREYGPQKIAEIDTCDMAGPGFDKYKQTDPKQSAQNVQCIHTSMDKGTSQRNCHQDWVMGLCGIMQLAASNVAPNGSHGLCPIFYNKAFENNFYAEANPRQCGVGRIKRYWPKKFKMGYMENRKNSVTGLFYASTTRNAPYTKTENKIKIPEEAALEFWIDGKKYYIN